MNIGKTQVTSMITNSKKWNDPDYYEENFVNIIYDKLTEGMGLSKDERKSLLDLLLNQRHDPMYYDIICQEFKNHLFKEEVRTIFRLNGKYFEIRWIRKNESFDEPDEFPNDPIEVVKTTRVVKEWVAKSDQYNFDPVLLKEQKAKLQKYLKKIDCILDILEMEKMDYKCKEFVSYGKRYRREMGAEQIMPLSTAIDIVESMFFKEIAERYFDSSNIKDKTAAADEVLRIYEILTVHQKRLVLQKILKKEDND